MGDKTSIEWSDATWNPTTGCDRVSPGCSNCYALDLAARLKAMGVTAYQRDGGRASGPGFGLTLHPDRLNMPLRWRKPRRVFVNSMSDLFHEDVPFDFIDRVFAVMALTPQHTFQVLTKRPERMREYMFTEKDGGWTTPQRIVSKAAARAKEQPKEWAALASRIAHARFWPLPNVWLGVSIENQHWADVRIPVLLDTPAAVRFLSCEPLLGPLDFGFCPHISLTGTGRLAPAPNRGVWECDDCAAFIEDDAPMRHTGQPRRLLTQGPRPALSWVIAGGESAGPAKRALVERWQEGIGPDAGWEWVPKAQSLLWIQDIRDQCVAAGVPFFFKQWGGPHPKSGGRLLDGRTWDQFPEAPA